MIDIEKPNAAPLYYVHGSAIFRRPVVMKRKTKLGFKVCDVCPGVKPEDVCKILNKGDSEGRHT